MRIVIFLFLFQLFFSCSKKREESAIPFSEASYKVKVTMNWVSPQLGVPAGAHVTTLTGMIHNKDTFLWMPGRLATAGLEDVAEIGNNIKMNKELDDILLKNTALSKFSISPPSVTGTVEMNLNFNHFVLLKKHSYHYTEVSSRIGFWANFGINKDYGAFSS